jgi:hypothetical protein
MGWPCGCPVVADADTTQEFSNMESRGDGDNLEAGHCVCISLLVKSSRVPFIPEYLKIPTGNHQGRTAIDLEPTFRV